MNVYYSAKSIKRTAGEGAFWLGFSSIAIKIAGFLYVLLLLSQLSLYEYGLVALVLSIPPLLGLFHLAGMQPVMIADLIRFRTNNNLVALRSHLTSFLSLRLILAVFAGAGLFLSTFLFSSFFESSTLLLVQILSISFFAGPFRALLTISYNVNSDFKLLAGFRISEEVCKLSIVALLLLVYKLGPLGVIIAYVATEYIAVLLYSFYIFWFRKMVMDGKLFDSSWRHPFKCLAGHAKWSVLHSSVAGQGKHLRPWIIQMILGTEVVGLYAVARGLIQHTASLIPFASLITPLVPRFTDEPKQLARLLNAAVRYQAIMQLVTILSAAIVLPFILKIFFPEYFLAYPLYLALVGVLFLESISDLYETVFHALQKQKDMFWATTIRLGTVIIFLPLGCIWFGMWGIAIEAMLTQALYLYNRYYILRRESSHFKLDMASILRITELDVLLWSNFKKQIQKKLKN